MYKRIFEKTRFAALLLSLVILISALPLNVIAAAPDTSEAETDTVIPDERSSYTDSELTEEEINATGDTSLYIGVDDFCEATRDGAIYSFANSASSKYLTVGISGNGGYYDDGEIDEIEGTNVYQSTKSGLLSQAFRLDYDTELECFRIRAMCVNNGYGSVLDYPSESYNDSSYGNLRIYSYDESWSDDQGWVIIAYNNSDLFRISPAYDTDLAVTACGTADGSESGTSMTSPGNVYVTEFTGATNQLWRLESGGIQVVNGIDIREAYDNGANYANVSENSTALSLCCPVDSTDASYITWTSSNMSVATVNSIGKVTAKKAGLATITASVSYDGDDGCDVYTFTVYVVLKDGTYYFNNAKNDLRLEFKYSNAYSESSPLEAYNSGTTEPTGIFRMFKIKYVGSGYYVIRSMVDCSMGWTCPDSSSTELVATTIGTSDNSVQTRSKWRIQSNANGYYIFNCAYGTKKTIASPSSSGNIRLEQYTYSTNQPNDKLQNWVIKEITSEHHGVTLTSNADTVGVGGSYRFKAAVHSTYTGEYGQRGYTWSVTNGTGSATVNSGGVLTGVSVGTVVLTVTYKVNSSTQWTFSRTIHIGPLAAGTYFIKNRHYNLYTQVDADDAPNYSTNGGTIDIQKLNGGNYQKWILSYADSGYYKITSGISGYAITVPSGSESADNVDLILTPYTGSNNQKWKISRTSHGSYKIKAKSSESYTTKDLAMNMEPHLLFTTGLKIRQKEYVDDTGYKDEWDLTQMPPTNGYELDYTPSSWSSYVQNCCNCYAYALNNQVYPGTNYIWFKQQMGYYKGAGYMYSSLTEANIYNAVTNDFSAYNKSFIFKRIGRYDVCPIGTYKVALVVSSADYHWYRQDADGLWSHKIGLDPVKRTDESGNLIIDPYTADRGSYTTFLGYYAVTPWSQMFAKSGTVYCYVQGQIVTYTALMNYISMYRAEQYTTSSCNIDETDVVAIVRNSITYESIYDFDERRKK